MCESKAEGLRSGLAGASAQEEELFPNLLEEDGKECFVKEKGEVSFEAPKRMEDEEEEVEEEEAEANGDVRVGKDSLGAAKGLLEKEEEEEAIETDALPMMLLAPLPDVVFFSSAEEEEVFPAV